MHPSVPLLVLCLALAAPFAIARLVLELRIRRALKRIAQLEAQHGPSRYGDTLVLTPRANTNAGAVRAHMKGVA